MRLLALIVAGILAGGGLAVGQGAAPAVASSQDGTGSPAQGTASSQEKPNSTELPVSLNNIRAGLKRQATDSLLRQSELPADFRMKIIQQQKIDDLLSKLDFKSGQGPAPAGGLYGYEQQQRLFNPVDHPLVQPYAAFSGGELITIAIENLMAKYLGGRALNAVTDAERAKAEKAARDEVDQSIADYCATRPDRYEITLCNPR